MSDACTYTPVKMNQCPEVVDLSVGNTLLCKSCCIPSREFFNVLVDETVITGDLVMLDGTDIKPWDEAAAADIIGIADCSAAATVDCPGQVCVYVRDAVLKCAAIAIPAGKEADVIAHLKTLRIFFAYTV
jgi:hypothetical protein